MTIARPRGSAPYLGFNDTAPLVRAGTQTVTRRLGWAWVRPGDRLHAVRKQKAVQRAGAEALGTLRIVDVRREPLQRLLDEPAYGRAEVRRMGFGDDPVYREPSWWARKFRAENRYCAADVVVTRLEFVREPEPEAVS